VSWLVRRLPESAPVLPARKKPRSPSSHPGLGAERLATCFGRRRAAQRVVRIVTGVLPRFTLRRALLCSWNSICGCWLAAGGVAGAARPGCAGRGMSAQLVESLLVTPAEDVVPTWRGDGSIGILVLVLGPAASGIVAIVGLTGWAPVNTVLRGVAWSPVRPGEPDLPRAGRTLAAGCGAGWQSASPRQGR
jgi:hypothetical protein